MSPVRVVRLLEFIAFLLTAIFSPLPELLIYIFGLYTWSIVQIWLNYVFVFILLAIISDSMLLSLASIYRKRVRRYI